MGGQHKILLKSVKNGHHWTYSFPALLLWCWPGKGALQAS